MNWTNVNECELPYVELNKTTKLTSVGLFRIILNYYYANYSELNLNAMFSRVTHVEVCLSISLDFISVLYKLLI